MNRNTRWANLGLGQATSVNGFADRIQTWHYGEIEVCRGELLAIYPRWWPKFASQWEAWRDSYLRRPPVDVCRIYYAFPRRTPDYLTVIYAHAGPKTQLKTLFRGVRLVDEIAAIWKVKAIVCQATNARLNERLMRRLGYVRHAFSLGENHYIKRMT